MITAYTRSASTASRSTASMRFTQPELVIAYAAWISVKVIRVFLDQLSGNPGQLQLASNDRHDAHDLDASIVNEIVSTTTRNIVETLHRQRKLIEWQTVIEAVQNPQTDMAFADLTGLTHACLNRLQRAIDAEAYVTIARRAANQGVNTSQVSLNA